VTITESFLFISILKVFNGITKKTIWLFKSKSRPRILGRHRVISCVVIVDVVVIAVMEGKAYPRGSMERVRSMIYLEMLFLLGFSEVDSRKEADDRRRDSLRSFFSFCLRANNLAYSLASALALAMRVRFCALTRRAR